MRKIVMHGMGPKELMNVRFLLVATSDSDELVAVGNDPDLVKWFEWSKSATKELQRLTGRIGELEKLLETERKSHVEYLPELKASDLDVLPADHVLGTHWGKIES